jgi:hypothetical protein
MRSCQGFILKAKRGWRLRFILFVFLGYLTPLLSASGQQIKWEGWPVPDLKGLVPYSVSVQKVDDVEKITEKFHTPAGGHVARIIGNGKVFAYAIDRDQDPPIDALILDPDGSGKFTLKYGPEDVYVIPEWVSR